ncbi:MAG: AMP-binding protein [Cryomorphaceae bacterium]|nr:AMP-binding protein [Cryomorphaceae bacterium]
MIVSPYQNLFIQQELTYGSARNNILRGKAEIRNLDIVKLEEALNTCIASSAWSHLRLSQDFTEWYVSEKLSGKLHLQKKNVFPEICLQNLWEISLVGNSELSTLEVYMHHALADAHTFQLFWSGLKNVFQGNNEIAFGVHPILSEFCVLDIPNIKHVEGQGIGPVERLTIQVAGWRKNQAEEQLKSKGVLLSTLLLGVLQNELDHIEKFVGIELQTGFALRNRSGRAARNSFPTAVNFLPVPHKGLNDLHELEYWIKQLFRHQDYPLLEWLNDNGRTTAFNVLFSYQKEDYHQSDMFAQSKLTFLPAAEDETVLGLHVLDFGTDELTLSFDVRTDIADRIFWRTFIAQYLRAVHALVNSIPSQFTFHPVSIHSEYVTSNLWGKFLSAPDEKIALYSGAAELTFGDLRKQLNDSTLTEGNSLVFVEPDRSIESIVKILNAWQLGKTVTFSQSSDLELPKGDLLYLAETSGSTGIPKRIGIQRSGIESMLDSWSKKLIIDDASVHLSTADQRFDVFFGDIFRSLFTGNTLVLASEEERLSPGILARLINDRGVTHYESTPSWLKLLLPNLKDNQSLKVLISGSEPMSSRFFEDIRTTLNNQVKVFNSYGLTEVSIDSALTELVKTQGDQFPVGFPLGDQNFRIRNKYGEHLPAGLWGELMISGSCVGIPVVWDHDKYSSSNGELTFFTGDRAMIHPEYGLIVKGRLEEDFIKVHGKRIPIKDLEASLCQLTDARNAYVFERKGAIIAIHDSVLDSNKVLKILSQRFSRHQLPDHIFSVDHWPMNRNGKTDKEKLRDQAVIPEQTEAPWLPGEPDLEKKLFNELERSGKKWGGKDVSLLWYGWSSIDLLSFCNELNVKGMKVNASGLIRQPTISEILKQLDCKNEVSSINSAELNLEDDDFDDILSILNQ